MVSGIDALNNLQRFMQILSHIVAASENNVIGSKNNLPWNLPNDFRYFKSKTWGMPVIMGRKSFESLQKDLPGRINIVITSRHDLHPPNVFVVDNIKDALKKAEEADTKEIFIIGGGEIFRQTIDIVTRIYLTRVHTVIEGDTYYPEIKKEAWTRVSAQSFPADEKHNYAYTFEVWEKNPVIT
jgi:dihydrofolate reductase